MSRTITLFLLGLLTAANIAALVVNTTMPAQAAVAGLSYKKLVNDKDFTLAVKHIVQSCKVNVDLGKLSC